MSYLDDSDDHLRWLAPTDLNLDYMGITDLDCVTRVLIHTDNISGNPLRRYEIYLLQQKLFVFNFWQLSEDTISKKTIALFFGLD